MALAQRIARRFPDPGGEPLTDRGLDERARQVDPWRFAGGFLQKVLSGRIPDAPAWDAIPWTPVSKPLARLLRVTSLPR